CVFFFFQAEDGIRDFHVTGVQTCALPICELQIVGERVAVDDREIGRDAVEHEPAVEHVTEIEREPARQQAEREQADDSAGTWVRSEERRVGKECRCRWSAEREKKKK